jgi:hypothetical protein
MATLEDRVRENTDMMRDLLQQMRGGTNYNPTPSGSSPTGTGAVGEAAKNVVNGLFASAGALETFVGKLVRQTAGIPDLTNILTSGITPMFGGLGKLLGDAFGGTIQFVDESVKNWQDFSKLGPTMYGNAMNVNASMGKMRLNYDDFADVIKNMGSGGLSFGRSLTEATFLFSSAVDHFAKSDYQKNFQMLGIKEKERADIMGNVIRGWTGLNLQNEDAMDRVAKATDSLAKSMALTAETMGVSREKQLDAIKEFAEDARSYAKKEQHLLNGDLIYSELQKTVAIGMKNAPAMVRDAAIQATSNNGQVYGPAQDVMNQLAPRTLAMMQQQARIIEDVTQSDADRRKAAEYMKNINEHMTAEVMTNQSRMLTIYDNLSAEQKETLKGLQPFREAITREISQSGNNKMTLEEAINKVRENGEFNIAGGNNLVNGGPPGLKPGEVDPGRESTMAYLNVQSRIKDLGEATIKQVDVFNRELGKAGGGLEKFNNLPWINNGKEAANKAEELKNKIQPDGWDKMSDAEKTLHNMKETTTGYSKMFLGSSKIMDPDKKGLGGSSSAGIGTIFGELGFEYKADEAATRVYNNGQTKTLIASMTDGMRMFPILSGQLQRVAPEVAQVVSNAITNSSSNSIANQDILVSEIKNLNTTMEAVAGFTKNTADAVKQTVKAIEASDSVY